MLKEIREKFLDFFAKKDHLVLKSAPIIPKSDPTLLFINSGMAPMKKYFLQEETPPSSRVANSQHCLRVGGKHNDLSEVGYTKRHHTFFEMLGNFSFSDYFKKEAISMAWEFLTKELKIDESRLFITVHPDDFEAYSFWAAIIDENKIIKLEENVWSVGPVGPFGFCSEIFYDLQVGEGDFSSGDRYLEIWNIVFMENYSDGKVQTKLKNPCIDAGMGLERIVSVLEGVDDTYKISFFKNALRVLGLDHESVESKIFLDHLRSIAIITAEKIMPGPSKKEYVLRRLLRRAIKAFHDLNLEKSLKNAAREILSLWSKDYPDLNIDFTIEVLDQEEEQFGKVLEGGFKIFKDLSQKGSLSGEEIYYLHDTHGILIDIVEDLSKKHGIKADVEAFEKIMEKNKEKNKKQKISALPFAKTQFSADISDCYEMEVEVIGIHENYIILNKTPFYAESGGQIADTGTIKSGSYSVEIKDVQKSGDVFLHEVESGIDKVGLGKAIAIIDKERRFKIIPHHSATHLLHLALAKVLGDHVAQKGSLVSFDRLRFDFSHSKSLSEKEIQEVEDMVNLWILENHKVEIKTMNLNDAIEAGAKALFEDKYQSEVRTIKMGPSFELCGGIHAKSTGQLGFFKIIKTSSISASVKRIEAVAGMAAFEYLKENLDFIAELKNNFKANSINQLKDKVISAPKAKKESEASVSIKKTGANPAFSFVVLKNISIDEIEKHMKELKVDLGVFVEEKNEKIGVSIKVNNSNEKIDALQIAKAMKDLIGAKGAGGRTDFAKTGGIKVASIEEMHSFLSNNLF